MNVDMQCCNTPICNNIIVIQASIMVYNTSLSTAIQAYTMTWHCATTYVMAYWYSDV